MSQYSAMQPLTIRVDYNTGYMRGLFVILMMFGLLLMIVQIYQFITNQLTADWHITFILAASAFLAGLLHVSGYSFSFVQQPEIQITNKGFQSAKVSDPVRTIEWGQLKAVTLTQNAIIIHYRKPDSQDKIRLPFHTKKQFREIEIKLREAAEKYGLEFRKR